MNTILLTIYISKSLERFLTYFAKCVSINEHINGSYTKTVGPNLMKFSGLFVLIYTYNMFEFQKTSYYRTGGRGGAGASLKIRLSLKKTLIGKKYMTEILFQRPFIFIIIP